jgi:hypothetical protein
MSRRPPTPAEVMLMDRARAEWVSVRLAARVPSVAPLIPAEDLWLTPDSTRPTGTPG